jgi:hypothetical protein
LARPIVDEADRLFLTFKTRRNGGDAGHYE